MLLQTISAISLLSLILSCSEITQETNACSPNVFVADPIEKIDSGNDSIARFGIDSIAINLVFKTTSTYSEEKKHIFNLQKEYALIYDNIKTEEEKSIFLDSVSKAFTETLLNRIIPHWYGTPWDFEGHTSIPNKGTIACGYFVSTTLSHMGIEVNRYKLAQQWPKDEAISIAIDSNLVTAISENKVLTHLMELKEGLYFIGLDNHVGYLLKRNNVSYFLHSNYIENRVMIEKVNDSDAFYSTYYYFADITWKIRIK